MQQIYYINTLIDDRLIGKFRLCHSDKLFFMVKWSNAKHIQGQQL